MRRAPFVVLAAASTLREQRPVRGRAPNPPMPPESTPQRLSHSATLRRARHHQTPPISRLSSKQDSRTAVPPHSAGPRPVPDRAAGNRKRARRARRPRGSARSRLPRAGIVRTSVPVRIGARPPIGAPDSGAEKVRFGDWRSRRQTRMGPPGSATTRSPGQAQPRIVRAKSRRGPPGPAAAWFGGVSATAHARRPGGSSGLGAPAPCSARPGPGGSSEPSPTTQARHLEFDLDEAARKTRLRNCAL